MTLKLKLPVLQVGEYFGRFIPKIKTPDVYISLKDRLLWTLGILFVYQICCQIPLYSPTNMSSIDPLFWLRSIFASEKGTLMQLGVVPLLTADLLLHFCSLFDTSLVKLSEKENSLRRYNLKRGLCFFFGLIEALGYTFSGVYGYFNLFNIKNYGIILLQLFFSNFLLMLFEDILNTGYGFNVADFHLFIVSSICSKHIWRILSPITITTSNGSSKEGSFPALFQLLLTKTNKFYALAEVFGRSYAPNLFSVILLIIVFLIVLYVQGYHMKVLIKNQRVRKQQSNYPIKLFYTSSLPLILQAALLYNFYLFSLLIFTQFSSNFFVNLIGIWKLNEGTQTMVPSGGLVYYISPPLTFLAIVCEPIHTFLYITFRLLTCLLFSYTWLLISGSSSKNVAYSLRSQGMVVRGHRDTSMVNFFNRYIPTACLFGGISFGCLCIAGDFLGYAGLGTTTFIAASTIYQYYEEIAREKSIMF